MIMMFIAMCMLEIHYIALDELLKKYYDDIMNEILILFMTFFFGKICRGVETNSNLKR